MAEALLPGVVAYFIAGKFPEFYRGLVNEK